MKIYRQILVLLIVSFSFLNCFAQTQNNDKNVVGIYEQKPISGCRNTIVLKANGTFEKKYVASTAHYIEFDTVTGNWVLLADTLILNYQDHYKKQAEYKYTIANRKNLIEVKGLECTYQKK